LPRKKAVANVGVKHILAMKAKHSKKIVRHDR